MKSLLKLAAAAGILLICLWLSGKVFPLVAPFLFSLAAAALAEPIVAALCKRGVSRGLSAVLVCTMVLTVLIGAVWGITAWGMQTLTAYAGRAPTMLSALTDTLSRLRSHGLLLLHNLPDSIADELVSATDGLSQQLSALPLRLSEQALSGLTSFAKRTPDWMLFLCTAVIGMYFFSVYYEEIKGFFRRQIPTGLSEKLQLMGSVTFGALTGYLKVQCVISGVTFAVLLIALRMLGIGSILPAAAGIAVVDALPILGSGAVMLPWALICLIAGNVPRAMGLLLIYGVLVVLHNILQARLMGNQLGLHPVVALVCLYAGWKLAGLAGMLLLPIVCVLVITVNNAGIIKLYQ